LRRQTRTWGRFRYEVILPLDEDHIEATLNDGVLQVRISKRSTGRRHHINVN
jgi:HSP20 family protein